MAVLFFNGLTDHTVKAIAIGLLLTLYITPLIKQVMYEITE